MRLVPLTLLALCFAPATALGAEIRTQDTIAGLQTEITLEGFSASSTLDIVVETPDGANIEQSVRTDGRGDTVVAVGGSDTERAGIYRVTVFDGTRREQETFNVLPDRLDLYESSISAGASRIAADGADNVIVDVILRDRFQNPLPDRPVTLIPSRTEDVVRAEGDVTDGQGRQRFRLASDVPGTATLRAMDLLSGMIVEESVQVIVGNAPQGNADPWSAFAPPPGYGLTAQLTGGSALLDRFEITVPQTMEADKEASKITVRAVDRNGKTVENYTGTVKFSSTDNSATLPNFGTYTFKQRDLGAKEFALVLKFRKPGVQTLTVQDSQDSRIVGETEITVTGKAGQTGSQDKLTITSPRPGITLGGAEVQVEGTGPALINIIIKGGFRNVTTETDENGRFSALVALDPSLSDIALVAEDEDGRSLASDPVKIKLDAMEPVIGGVTFTPPTPEVGAQTLVVVKSEPKLKSVSMTLARNGQPIGQPFMLLENPSAPGSYQTFFTAPPVGSYQPAFATVDAVGNEGKYLTDFNVQPKALPVVQGLKGEARSDAVLLQWSDITEADFTGYRVYIGEAEDDLPFTLDTGATQPRATVKGLLPGRRYFFAVTAVKGEQESRARSAVIALDTIGIRLSIAPQDTSLQLQWTGVPENLPLQSYVLEYGVAEGAYVEKRILSGDAELYVLRDLLNAVTYHLRLTPITVNGERRDDLAVTGTGVPSGDPSGFNPTGSDPIPGDFQAPDPIIGESHEGAPPENTSVGLPIRLWLPVLALTSLLAGGYLYRRHQLAQTAAFLRALEQRHRS